MRRLARAGAIRERDERRHDQELRIIKKRRDPSDARRFVYRLSAKGIDLAPVLVELVMWSARYETTDAPPSVVRAMRSDRAAFIANVRRRWMASD